MGGCSMKVRLVHLLSEPTTERERRSIAEVSALAQFGAQYIQIVNPVYDGEVPPEREANDRVFTLTKAHYGCWKAHRDAIAEYLTDDIDALLISECDTVFVESPDKIWSRIERAVDVCQRHDILAFTLGYKHNSKTLETIDDVILISQWIESHCYLLLPKSKPVFMEMFAQPHDAYDYCLTIYLLDRGHQRVATFSDRPLAVQCRGVSLIDNRDKTSEDFFRAVRY